MLLQRLSLGCLCLFLASLATPAIGSDGPVAPNPYTNESVATAETGATSSSVGGVVAKIPFLIGTYPADGRFRAATTGFQFLEIGSEVMPGATRPAAVPPWVDLGSIEAVLEDYAPPARARKVYRKRRMFANFRDTLLGKAYGPERILLAPTHLVTDSKQRLILIDEIGPSIHVLDGANSFRIVGGPLRRIQHPKGVAVDADDNIYVADKDRELILVYDPQGMYLRQIGQYRGEAMFQTPSAIAIDRTAGRLYVLDQPYSEVVVLDLQGRVLKRIGGHRDLPEDVRFDHPSEIAVGQNRMAILDTMGTRVVLLDGSFNRVSEFTIGQVSRSGMARDMGLALDGAGNVYVAGGYTEGVRIYNESGKKIGAIDDVNMMFSGLSALWIDTANRMYVSDTNHRRVQVFEMTNR